MKTLTIILSLLTAVPSLSQLQSTPSGIPANNILSGAIVAYGGSNVDPAPSGWVLCDGKLYDRTDSRYKNLFDAIGTSWGGDGANKFAVPDLRGMFLRGVSGDRHNDPDEEKRGYSRPDLATSGNQKNAVGSTQPDEFLNHTHNYSAGWYHPSDKLAGGGQWRKVDAGDAKTSAVGGSETRPKNANVHFLIKL